MKVSEFIREKNRIIRKYTNFNLVPENQIQDIPFWGYMSLTEDMNCCPYCLYFEGCWKCPMSLAGNQCGDEGSTYDFVTRQYTTIADPKAPWAKELKELVERWNKGLRFFSEEEDKNRGAGGDPSEKQKIGGGGMKRDKEL